jgi:hypothetical protein
MPSNKNNGCVLLTVLVSVTWAEAKALQGKIAVISCFG